MFRRSRNAPPSETEPKTHFGADQLDEAAARAAADLGAHDRAYDTMEEPDPAERVAKALRFIERQSGTVIVIDEADLVRDILGKFEEAGGPEAYWQQVLAAQDEQEANSQQ